MKNALLEVCAFHIQSCLIAERSGAARVELCDNPIEGGTTPSYGTIQLVREKITIDLYPIIRPRAGNYFYTDDEFEIIKRDINICKQLGCDGISIGIQKQDGTIDKERMKLCVEIAGDMGITCNRVFDNAPDAFIALEDIIECGCERILTSGMETAASPGAVLLAKLVQQACNRIIIMPGAGVNSGNIAQLQQQTGAKEFHSSARKAALNPVSFMNKKVSDYGHVYIADETEVLAMVNALI